jgi:hypothetical protein
VLEIQCGVAAFDFTAMIGHNAIGKTKRNRSGNRICAEKGQSQKPHMPKKSEKGKKRG